VCIVDRVVIASEKIIRNNRQHADLSIKSAALILQSEPAFEEGREGGRDQVKAQGKETYPFFCMPCKNFTITLLLGRIRTCLFPRFSAFERVFKQSASTDMRTMVITGFVFVLGTELR